MDFAGVQAGVDTDPGHLSRLAALRDKPSRHGVYTIKTWPSQVYFDLAHPMAQDVRLIDIVHSLSMQCRYGGHVPSHFSIAQHSILVAKFALHFGLPEEFQSHALMHDAHEAYNQDLTKPLKNFIGRTYENVSHDIQAAIMRALGLRPLSAEYASIIKEADSAVTVLEQAAKSRGDMRIDSQSPVLVYQHAWEFATARLMFQGACLQFLKRNGAMETAWEGMPTVDASQTCGNFPSGLTT